MEEDEKSLYVRILLRSSKKDTENIDTDDYYTREMVHTKKVKVAKTK